MVPTVELPPATPFTNQVTAVLVFTVVLERFTCALILALVLMPTLRAAGVRATEVTVALVVELPLPLPQAVKPASNAATKPPKRILSTFNGILCTPVRGDLIDSGKR